MSNELWQKDAVSLSKMIREKEVSALEVAKAAIERMERVDRTIHAFCTPTPELALQAARNVDAALAKGQTLLPMAGVPIGIKDQLSMKGVVSTSGSAAYRDFVPDEDDVVVERLKRAGAIILGKTNIPEFGYSGVGHNPIFETTKNPWNTELTPGGSSAGSGASVAAGVTPFAVAADGGGSIRIPAAHCGLVGFKASMGRVPLYPCCRDERYPGASSWESLEHIGPVSRTVADSALMLDVISGPDPRDRHTIPCADVDWLTAPEQACKGLRVAYSEDLGYVAVDPEVRRIVASAVKVFESELGCNVEAADPGWDDPFADFWGLVAMDSDLVGMRRQAAAHPGAVSPHLMEFLSRPWTAEDITDAITARKALNNHMWRFMENYDLLITPTLTVPPFPLYMQGPEKVEGKMVPPTQWLSFTFPINMTGQPAVSVPAGFTAAGLPVGLQIVGRHLADMSVMRAAAAFERAQPWANKWPELALTA